MKRIFTLLVFTFLFHAGYAQWVNLDSVPGSRASAAAFSIGDTGYIVSGGGWDGYPGYWDQTFKYNKATDSWTQLALYPSSTLDNGPTGFAIGDTGYVGLGVGGGYQYSSTFWKYDTRLNTWTAIAGFPGVGRNAAVAFVINGKAYVGGGLSGYYVPKNDFYAYDPSTGQWSAALAPCPARGLGVNAVGFAVNGKGYVGTGGNYTSGSTTWIPQSDFWTYDPNIDQWDSIASMPCGPRMGAVAFAIGNYGYVGTGVSDYQQQNFLRDFWRFDPSTGPLGTWVRIEDYAGGGRENASAFVIGNEGYVSGGNIPYPSAPTGSGMWSYTPDGIVTGVGGNLDIEPKSLSVCPGTSVQLTVTGSAGSGSGLVWSPSTGLNQSTGDTVTATITQNMIYMVTGASACGVATGTDTITISNSTTKAVVSPTDTLICSGSDVQLHVSGGTTYAWTPNAAINDTTSAIPYVAPTHNQVYTVIAKGGCTSDTLKVTVNVTPTIQVSITPSSATGCSNTQVPLSAGGATTYSWSPISGLDNPTSANPVATLSNNITYTVTGSTGACTGTDSVVITVGNTSTGGAVTAVRDTICLNTPGNLTLTGNSSNTVQWQSSTDDITFNNTSTGGTSLTYKTSPLQQSTWYRVLVGTGNCSAFSDTLQLYVPPALTASFYYTQAGANQLTFNSDSSIGNIRSYHWDFGDGQTSNDSNPSHTFAKDTTYYVCLTLYDGSNCSYTFCRYSSISDGVQTISAAGNWVIYPNPFTNELTVGSKQLAKSSKIQSIEMYDVLGRVVLNEESGNSANTTLQLDVSSLAKGMYYVMIRTADADYVQKVVKQ